MQLTARQRLLENTELRDFSNWPEIPLTSIPKKKQKQFLRNQQVVSLVLRGIKYSKITAQTGVKPPSISRLLTRALSGIASESPVLTQALIPNQHIHASSRKKALPTLAAPSGAKNAFTALLDSVPELRANLDALIEAHITDKAEVENLTPSGFHDSFLLFLEQAHHPKDVYPYTTDWWGRETLRQYLHQRTDELLQSRQTKKENQQIVTPGTPSFYFGREFQLDEYKEDAQTTILLEAPTGIEPHRVASFSLLLLSDHDTNCVLSYHLSLTLAPSQFDVLITLEKAFIPNTPADLSALGIKLPSVPHFPNQLGTDIHQVAIQNMALDNALAHHANTVRDYVCSVHKGTFHAGLPGQPKARCVVEEVFNYLNAQAKRHKSTTGSHPADPLRESRKNRKRPPVVLLSEFEAAIYAVLAKRNILPMGHLGGVSPLDAVSQSLNNTIPPLFNQALRKTRGPFRLQAKVPVKWLKNEGRKPHLNFLYQRYTGDALIGQKRGQSVTIEYDYRDIRILDVYDQYGKYLGQMKAPDSWMKYAHGVTTRTYICRYCRREKVHMIDPLVEFFWLQFKRKNRSKATLEIVRLARERNPGYITVLPSIPSEVPQSNEGNPTPEDLSHPPLQRTAKRDQSTTKVPEWSPSIAYSNNQKVPK